MKLQLNRPICFFDIESTGINIGKDRIIEISILKIFPNGKQEDKTWLIFPEMPIPPKSTAIHGIKDEDVEGKLPFKNVAIPILKMIENTDLAGYNSNRFDIPILVEEMLRAGISFDIKKHNTIDVQVIFHKMEPRNLSAAYKYYCKKDLVKAHSSKADTFATYEILLAQLEKYKDLKKDVKSLNKFSYQKNIADLAGFIKIDENGDEIFNFGKYKGEKIFKIFEKDTNYYDWIQNSDFPLYTKKVLTSIKLRKFNNN
ncbi:DNA polymerase III subunit epsilon [Blattabacterium punctulatus CPU2]|uniref:DNA polymerase III subunit epsilon n=1 Tax=Blattabacterium punctulatus CPU2 TaxID=1457032 RepID=A0AAD1FR04_9FLAO|nr:3'-5' exonuclease [Blattabacterium punctulatus]AWU39461.1 3'-5' exonuclease [Blattabacterium punctulatus]BBA17618.1 DNA polymerase III subunit epsilon [Blattabacterium punctulatus CPU2]